jgi:hypothetical protein
MANTAGREQNTEEMIVIGFVVLIILGAILISLGLNIGIFNPDKEAGDLREQFLQNLKNADQKLATADNLLDRAKPIS